MIALGVSKSANTSGATALSTAGVTTQATGSAFFVGVIVRNGTAPSSIVATDNMGNTYSPVGTTQVGDNTRTYGFVATNGVGGAGHTVTVTLNSSSAMSVAFQEMTGAATSGILLGSTGAGGFGGTTQGSGALAVTAPTSGVALISLMGTESSTSPAAFAESTAGMTITTSQDASAVYGASMALGAVIKTASGSYTATWADGGGGSYRAISIYAFAGGVAVNAIAGGASDTISAAGALATSIRLAASALDAITAAATLTNFSQVTLAAPLYTGVGGLFDPALTWPYGAPVAGSVISFDPTYLTVQTNGEFVWSANNVSAIVQYNNGSNTAIVTITTTAGLVGYAQTSTSSTGALTTGSGTGANLAGAATNATSATGALSTAIRLYASAIDLLSATGGLLTQINLASAASTSSTASGSLQASGGPLSGAAGDAITASGSLQTSIRLQAAATDTTAALGGLQTAIRLAGQALDTTLATASLAGSINLSGLASDTTAAGATLATAIQLADAATTQTLASGILATQVRLGAAANDVTLASGALLTQIRFAAGALDTSMGAGTLSGISASLAGAASDSIQSAGVLATHILMAGAASDITYAAGSIKGITQFMASAIDTTLAQATLSNYQAAHFDPRYSVGLRAAHHWAWNDE